MESTQQGEQVAPPPPGPTGPRVTLSEVRDLGRLRRTRRDDRMVAGVAGGLARHLDVDPTIVRVALVVLALFGGGGIAIYVAVWLLVPQDGDARAPIALEERSRGVVLIVVGVLALGAALGIVDGASWVPWPVLALAGVGYLVWRSSSGKDADRGHAASASLAPATAPGAQARPGVDPVTGYPLPPPPPPAWSAPRPQGPRRRGPLHLPGTLLLIALAVGGLGLAQALGVAVPASAYPASALAITGAMLVVGSFWGRTGGLVLLGLVALVATVGATAGDRIDPADFGERHATPTTAAAVRDVSLAVGDVEVDLSRVADVEALDGRTLRIEVGAGDVDVVVPDGIDVRVETTGGPGDADVLGESVSGTDKDLSRLLDRPGERTLTVEIDLGVGDITVEEAA